MTPKNASAITLTADFIRHMLFHMPNEVTS